MNGFIIVASLNKAFYEAAHNLIDSLLDHLPDANIALFAHDEWTKGDSRCDDLYLVHDCPKHIRSKLWALPKSPFDTTVYLDADTLVCHDDITDMFELKGNDMMFTNIRSYAGKIDKFIGGQMILHGGVFTYDTKKCTPFLEDWFDLYQKQIKDEWWPDEDIKPKHQLKGWDQFTLWWLSEYKYKDDIKIGIYDDDARYNYVYVYKDNECKGEIVVWHYTVPRSQIDKYRAESFKPTTQII